MLYLKQQRLLIGFANFCGGFNFCGLPLAFSCNIRQISADFVRFFYTSEVDVTYVCDTFDVAFFRPLFPVKKRYSVNACSVRWSVQCNPVNFSYPALSIGSPFPKTPVLFPKKHNTLFHYLLNLF